MAETQVPSAQAQQKTAAPANDDQHVQHKSLASAVRAVREDATYVLKRKVKGLDHPIKTEEDVIRAVREPMNKHGVILTPTNVEVLFRERFPVGQVRDDGTRSEWRYVSIKAHYKLWHVGSDEEEPVVVLAGGQHISDKADTVAMTMAEKTALLQAFQLESGNDPDRMRPPSAVGKNGEQKPAQGGEQKPRGGEFFIRVYRAIEEVKVNSETGEVLSDADACKRIDYYLEQSQKDKRLSKEELVQLSALAVKVKHKISPQQPPPPQTAPPAQQAQQPQTASVDAGPIL